MYIHNYNDLKVSKNSQLYIINESLNIKFKY